MREFQRRSERLRRKAEKLTEEIKDETIFASFKNHLVTVAQLETLYSRAVELLRAGVANAAFLSRLARLDPESRFGRDEKEDRLERRMRTTPSTPFMSVVVFLSYDVNEAVPVDVRKGLEEALALLDEDGLIEGLDSIRGWLAARVLCDTGSKWLREISRDMHPRRRGRYLNIDTVSNSEAKRLWALTKPLRIRTEPAMLLWRNEDMTIEYNSKSREGRDVPVQYTPYAIWETEEVAWFDQRANPAARARGYMWVFKGVSSEPSALDDMAPGDGR